MSTAVVDASAVLTLVLGEWGSAGVRVRLERWRRAEVSVHVPGHFWLEFTNPLVRRHAWDSSRVMAAIHALDEVGLQTVELSRPLVLLAVDLAERHGLTMYDAAYLALAETVDGELLTADRGLLGAAGARGIGLEGRDHRLAEARPTYAPRAPTWPSYRKASAYLSKLRSEATR